MFRIKQPAILATLYAQLYTASVRDNKVAAMTGVIATKQPKTAEALDDGSLIDVARSHGSSYIDAAYCYRRSSVICRPVTIASPAKMVEPIENSVWDVDSGMGPRKDVGLLDGLLSLAPAGE